MLSNVNQFNLPDLSTELSRAGFLDPQGGLNPDWQSGDILNPQNLSTVTPEPEKFMQSLIDTINDMLENMSANGNGNSLGAAALEAAANGIADLGGTL